MKPASIVGMTIRNQANEPMPLAAITIQFGAGSPPFCKSLLRNTTTNGSGYAVGPGDRWSLSSIVSKPCRWSTVSARTLAPCQRQGELPC